MQDSIIQVASGKFPLRAWWEGHACKGRSPSTEVRTAICRCSANSGTPKKCVFAKNGTQRGMRAKGYVQNGCAHVRTTNRFTCKMRLPVTRQLRLKIPPSFLFRNSFSFPYRDEQRTRRRSQERQARSCSKVILRTQTKKETEEGRSREGEKSGRSTDRGGRGQERERAGRSSREGGRGSSKGRGKETQEECEKEMEAAAEKTQSPLEQLEPQTSGDLISAVRGQETLRRCVQLLSAHKILAPDMPGREPLDINGPMVCDSVLVVVVSKRVDAETKSVNPFVAMSVQSESIQLDLRSER